MEFDTLDGGHVNINMLFLNSTCCGVLHCSEAPISSLEQCPSSGGVGVAARVAPGWLGKKVSLTGI